MPDAAGRQLQIFVRVLRLGLGKPLRNIKCTDGEKSCRQPLPFEVPNNACRHFKALHGPLAAEVTADEQRKKAAAVQAYLDNALAMTAHMAPAATPRRVGLVPLRARELDRKSDTISRKVSVKTKTGRSPRPKILNCY